MGNPLAIAFGDPAAPSTGLFGRIPEPDQGFRLPRHPRHDRARQGNRLTRSTEQRRRTRPISLDAPPAARTPLMEAQRFPNDYHGILAGAPAFNRTPAHGRPCACGRTPMRARTARLIQPSQMTLINQTDAQAVRRPRTAAPPPTSLPDPIRAIVTSIRSGAAACKGGQELPPACLDLRPGHDHGEILRRHGRPGERAGHQSRPRARRVTDNIPGARVGVAGEPSGTGIRRPILLGVRPGASAIPPAR